VSTVTDGTGQPVSAARFVGQRVPRLEDARFITGKGRYLDDIVVPGMLHAAFVRSNVARGTILEVDTSEALALPGVVAVLVASDVNHLVKDHFVDQELAHPPARPFRLLADGDVRFVGEPIAMVIAESRYLAEDGVDLVMVDVDPLPPLVDYERSLDPDAPLVHPERDSNVSSTIPSNEDPEVARLIESAPVVLTETFRQHRYNCVPMETRGTIADWDPATAELRVWTATQGPFGVRSWLARLLGEDESRIRVIMSDVGGAFGMKMFPAPDEISTVLASRVLGRPVKWAEDRREHLMAGWQSREEQGTMTLALDDDGRFIAGRCEFLENAGAFPAAASSSMILSKMVMSGSYRFDAFDSGGQAVFTNTTGRCGYRAPWMIETTVREQMIDLAAAELGIDPLELRRRNIVHDDDLPYAMPSGFQLSDVTTSATLEQAAEILGYDDLRAKQKAWRDEGRLVGIGISLACEPTAMAFGPMATEAVTMRIGVNGSVDVITSAISNGQSVETTLAQVVADELGVDVNDVRMIQGDTAVSPLGGGSGGSRSAVFASGSAAAAAKQLRERVIAIAAHLFEAAPEDIEIVDSQVRVVGTPSKGMSIGDIAMKSLYEPGSLPPGQELGMEASLRYAPDGYCTWSNSCHMCLVEIDRSTGAVTIERYVVSEDCGVMINPNVVEGQIAGGVTQGIGGVLYEHLPFDEDGNPLATTFVDYLLPTATEVPEFEYGHIETPAPTNAGGHKGLGEGGALAASAAVCNAVSDALRPLGARMTSQPISPAAVLRAIDEATQA
jgi:carbon-monoxide dehydrogenase large subunit